METMIKAMKRIKEENPSVSIIRLQEEGGWGSFSFDAKESSMKIILTLMKDVFIEEKDDYHTVQQVKTFPLFTKKETVVEMGDHQGYNDKGEPIIITFFPKPLLVLVNEMLAFIRTFDNNVVDQANKLYIHDSTISRTEEAKREQKENFEDKITKESKEILKTLKDGEALMPEIKEIEGGLDE